MSEFYYYKGLYKVKVVTESEGYWIVEALEDFKDCIEGEKVPVKAGERRIVQPNDLVKKDTLLPMVPEHSYELQLEKKVKRMVEKYDKGKSKE
ncbi:MAG: hypothetical protein M1490_04225 [Candidatus Bathyarchaeota archaeon]|nr:hypothetical protein [Candidatus Bathyarchaeota archaeon]